MEMNQKYAVLKMREDGEWGLLTTRYQKDGEESIRKSLSDWQWHVFMGVTIRVAIIQMMQGDKWNLIKFI